MKRVLIFCACLIATTAFAQSQDQIDAARAYVNTPVQQKLLDDMLSADAVMAQLKLAGNNIPAEKQQVIATIVSEEMNTMKPLMVDAIVQGMATNFTLDEINALTEFYSSPLGASAMAKITPFMQQTMQTIAPEFQKMKVSMGRRIQDEMRK